jgi:hypothetical protein
MRKHGQTEERKTRENKGHKIRKSITLMFFGIVLLFMRFINVIVSSSISLSVSMMVMMCCI